MDEMPTPQMRHERSLQDAKTTNDLAKAAAQATILINGAAATALLAYAASLSKATSSCALKGLPLPLALYAAGVLFGAFMTIFSHSVLKNGCSTGFQKRTDHIAKSFSAKRCYGGGCF
jgi:hypothetical protein